MGSGESRRRPVRISVPSRADSLLGSLTELVGGPLGRRTSPGMVHPGTFTVERVVILFTTIAAVLALVIKNPCRIAGWSSPGQYYQACYSQWPETFTRLAEGTPILGIGQSALTGSFAGVTAWLLPAGDTLRFYDLHSVLAVAAWLATVLATLRLANRRPWDAALVAVAPMIVVAGFIGWDLWALMFTTCGMLAFARHQFVAAGVLLGVATAIAGYPVLVFGAVALLAVRTRHLLQAALTGAVLAGTWLVVNLPFAVADPRTWWGELVAPVTRDAGYSSVWFVFNSLSARAGGGELNPATVTVLSSVIFGLCCLGIAALVLRAPRRPRLAQVAVLLVGALILTGPEYAPQHALWLIPLVALAYPRWRTFLTWQLLEVAHWWALMMYLGRETSGGAPQNNIDLPYYLLATFGHILATAYIMYRVIECILDPAQDPVRRLNVDDPQGGPFDQFPERSSQGQRHRAPNAARVRLSGPVSEPKDSP